MRASIVSLVTGAVFLFPSLNVRGHTTVTMPSLSSWYLSNHKFNSSLVLQVSVIWPLLALSCEAMVSFDAISAKLLAPLTVVTGRILYAPATLIYISRCTLSLPSKYLFAYQLVNCAEVTLRVTSLPLMEIMSLFRLFLQKLTRFWAPCTELTGTHNVWPSLDVTW